MTLTILQCFLVFPFNSYSHYFSHSFSLSFSVFFSLFPSLISPNFSLCFSLFFTFFLSFSLSFSLSYTLSYSLFPSFSLSISLFFTIFLTSPSFPLSFLILEKFCTLSISFAFYFSPPFSLFLFLSVYFLIREKYFILSFSLFFTRNVSLYFFVRVNPPSSLCLSVSLALPLSWSRFYSVSFFHLIKCF